MNINDSVVELCVLHLEALKELRENKKLLKECKLHIESMCEYIEETNTDEEWFKTTTVRNFLREK